MSNNICKLVKVSEVKNEIGTQYTHAYGSLEIETWMSASVADKAGAREMVGAVYLVREGQRQKVLATERGPGIRNTIIVHSEFGAVIVKYSRDGIAKTLFLESLLTNAPATVDMTARVKAQAAHELRVKANLSDLECETIGIFHERLARESREAAAAAERNLLEGLQKRQREQEEREADEHRERQAARERRINEILERGKLGVETRDRRVLWGYPVEGNEWEILLHGTHCVMGKGEFLTYFQVKKTRGGRASKMNEQLVTPVRKQVAHTPEDASQNANVIELVNLVGRDKPIAVFTKMEELREYLRLNPGSEGGFKGQGGKVQVFSFHNGALSSKGHCDIAA